MKKAFIICTVRGASEEYKKKLEDYVANLESEGWEVHLPHRDTNQNATGYEICTQNARAIAACNEVHIFYNPDSQGTHFDMGVAFAYGRKIVVAEEFTYGPGKSFARMLDEWSTIYKPNDYDLEYKLQQKEMELEELRMLNSSFWDMWGSELCVGDLISKEQKIEDEIEEIKNKIKIKTNA